MEYINLVKNCLEHLADIYLDYLHSILNSLNATDIDSGLDMVHYEDDVIFMLTTTFNQKNNEYSNTSVIDLGECELKLERHIIYQEMILFIY